VGRASIAEKYEFETFVLRFNLAHHDKAQGITVEIQAFFEVPHVDVIVIKSEFHRTFSKSCPTSHIRKILLEGARAMIVQLASGQAKTSLPLFIARFVASIALFVKIPLQFVGSIIEI